MSKFYETWECVVNLDTELTEPIEVRRTTFRVPERGILEATMADILPVGVEGRHILDITLTYRDSEMK